MHTALRETHEELGLPPDNVEVLGMLDPPEYSLGNKSRVWPFVVRVLAGLVTKADPSAGFCTFGAIIERVYFRSITVNRYSPPDAFARRSLIALHFSTI